MKFFSAFSCFILCWMFSATDTVLAQAPIAVTANDHVTVTLFFPSNVSKVVPPAVNYKFEYEQNSNMGLLKARNGNPSNLTVITEEGNIYSFALSFAEDVSNFTYILNASQAIGKTKPFDSTKIPAQKEEKEPITVSTAEKSNTGNESTMPSSTKPKDGKEAIEDTTKPTIVEPVLQVKQTEDSLDSDVAYNAGMKEEADLYDEDKQEYYRIFCENNYLQKTIFKRSFRQNKRVVLKLNNILVDREEIYFVLQIENNSKKEYKVNGLSFFKKSSVGKLQKIMTPRYKFNLQEIIDPESINEVVYVFKKFKITSKERINVVLDEQENERMVMLPLDNKQVNSPSN